MATALTRISHQGRARTPSGPDSSRRALPLDLDHRARADGQLLMHRAARRVQRQPRHPVGHLGDHQRQGDRAAPTRHRDQVAAAAPIPAAVRADSRHHRGPRGARQIRLAVL